jgi:hypothetical protein
MLIDFVLLDSRLESNQEEEKKTHHSNQEEEKTTHHGFV